MSPSHIRLDLVRKALREMGPELWTKDLSERSDMRQGHPALSGHRNYHAFVGAFLSQCPDVEIIPSGHDRSRGAMWRNKLSRVSSDHVQCRENGGSRSNDPQVLPAVGEVALGPQSASDQAFTARMRLHQSWFRATVLGVPCGTGPTAHSSSHYGNMLRPEDANAGLNFLSPAIYQVALERLRAGHGKVEPYRLLHNMLSSQPMCFNLFAPLVHDRELAASLLSAIPGLDVAEVVDVQLEYAPQPAQKYLADSTAFDAFIDYRRSDGTRAFLGIETKLTEPFPTKHYDGPRYRRWMVDPRAPWRPEAHELVDRIEHNQLWRDHLLATALLHHSESSFAAGALMLVRHPGDNSCARIVDGYRELLRDGDETFVDVPLDVLVAHWQEVVDKPEDREWLASFATRYLELERSAGVRP